jgi:carbonic anhydrase
MMTKLRPLWLNSVAMMTIAGYCHAESPLKGGSRSDLTPAPSPAANASLLPPPPPPPIPAAHKMLRDASLMLLKEGNERYVAGKPQHPNLDGERRSTTAGAGQEPFATILGCSDSRGPVELLFDRGVGDLFVIRVAGNIAGSSELASLEYGVGHLNTPLLVVLGHSRCGAVTAVTKGAELHGHLHVLSEQIEPAARKARAEANDADELIPRAIQANVWNMMERILRDSSVIREKASRSAVFVVGAIYDIESGRVTWLGGHPAQEAIIALANQTSLDSALAAAKATPATSKGAGAGASLPLPPTSKRSPGANGSIGRTPGGTATEPSASARGTAPDKPAQALTTIPTSASAGSTRSSRALANTGATEAGQGGGSSPAPRSREH